ncbi:peptidoglycan bridge formation glycyltransferase FemA/FemB family protein [Patescibacteria group bacterium]|nr:peptidoglycan bridge formation glycyltransferase FemA/FemB family protein [Patescibacteria group bacterium]
MTSLYQFKEIKREEEYNPLAIRPDAHFTQSWQYGEWQQSIDRDARRFSVQKNGNAVGTFQTITFKLPFGQNILYIPHGPVLAEPPDNNFFNAFGTFAKQLLQEERAIFLRFDFFPPDIAHYAAFPRAIRKAPTHIYHSAYFQPKNEWFIPLRDSEEKIIERITPKARYNARLAERKGVTAEISHDLEKYFSPFWSLLETTGKRDHFRPQPKTYYETIFRSCAEKKNAFLTIARHDKNILAINFIFLFGNTATFVYGGSSNEERNLMPSYLVQYETIRETKRLGFAFYNLGGVTDGSAQYKSWDGFTVFKKKFGGETKTYGEAYDIVAKPFWYYLYDAQRRIKTFLRS